MKKLAILFLIIVFLVSAPLAFTLEHHECTDEEHCPICEVLRQINHDKKTIGFLPKVIIVLPAIVLFLSTTLFIYNRYNKKDSPISLHERMLN